MPLPNDTTLSLQVHTNPGDPLHPKAKQAMIVRMSAETLEALEGFPNHPKMDFVFGNSPGIHIGDAFFPMRPLEEKTPHELYLRTSSAARPTTALKLYANVTGKFTVGRELVEKVENQIRDRAQEAEKQRTERKTILLQTPPDIGKSTNGKRKQEPQMFRRPTHAPDSHKNVSAPSGSQPSRFPSPRNVSASVGASSARVASPLPSTSQNGDLASLRKRLVHCVATQPRTTDDVVKLIGGSQCDSTKRSVIMTVLKEVAEPVPTSKHSTDAATWQLKTSSWTEVRPYEWQPLDASVRTTLARRARTAFSQLKIPETDPRWNHVRYRDPDAHGPTPAGSSKTAARAGTPDSVARPDAKKGITTKEAKQKKAKGAESTKKRASDTITARDEGTRPSKEVLAKGKERKIEQTHAAASHVSTPPVRPPARKLPGSGFKTKTDSAGGTPAPAPTQSTRGTSPAPSQPSRRQGPVDVRDKRPAPIPSSSARPAPPIPPPQTTQQRKPSNNATSGVGRPVKKVKAPSPLANEIDFEREREPVTAPKKRKKPAREEESESSEGEEPISASVQKKRRLEDARNAKERGREREPEKPRERHRDVSPPRKAPKREGSPLPSQRVKVKKEASPMSFTRSPLPASRPPASDVGRPPSSASSGSRAEHPHRHTGSAKPRRRSPIYTSSEDESPEPPRPQPTISKPIKIMKYKRRFRNPAVSLPSDREGLRQYYRDCWAIYIALYTEKARFISAYKKRLQNDENDSVSLSDSGEEPQLALFDPEVAKAFAADLTAVEAEMHRVTETLGERVEV